LKTQVQGRLSELQEEFNKWTTAPKKI
jgi:hypothetical protein